MISEECEYTCNHFAKALAFACSEEFMYLMYNTYMYVFADTYMYLYITVGVTDKLLPASSSTKCYCSSRMILNELAIVWPEFGK